MVTINDNVNISQRMSQRRRKAQKYAEELGFELFKSYPVVAMSYNYSTLPQIVNGSLSLLESIYSDRLPKYSRDSDPGKRVATTAVRKCIECFFTSEELADIGKQHMLDSAHERGAKGIDARGHNPYENGKFIVIGNRKYSEIEYIDFLKQGGNSWEEITGLVNSAFYPRTIKGVSAKYSRWKKTNHGTKNES